MIEYTQVCGSSIRLHNLTCGPAPVLIHSIGLSHATSWNSLSITAVKRLAMCIVV